MTVAGGLSPSSCFLFLLSTGKSFSWSLWVGGSINCLLRFLVSLWSLDLLCLCEWAYKKLEFTWLSLTPIHFNFHPNRHTEREIISQRETTAIPQRSSKKFLPQLLTGLITYWDLPPVRDESKEVQKPEGTTRIWEYEQTSPGHLVMLSCAARMNIALELLPRWQHWNYCLRDARIHTPSSHTMEKWMCWAICPKGEKGCKEVPSERVHFWIEIYEVKRTVSLILTPPPPAVIACSGHCLLKRGCEINRKMYIFMYRPIYIFINISSLSPFSTMSYLNLIDLHF